MKNQVFIALLLIVFTCRPACSQNVSDSTSIDMSKVISFALEGNIPQSLGVVNSQTESRLLHKHLKFKKEFNARFQDEADRSNFLSEKHSAIDSLLIIYRDYWRKSFKDYPRVYDTLLREKLSQFLQIHYKPAKNLKTSDLDEQFDKYLKGFIKSKGLHTTGFGQTGRFYDLLVWKKETDTVYTFVNDGHKIKTPIVFMERFITLGWEEYATLGKAFPGGWATPKVLYCVKESYDLTSESFLISYLAHEGRHFADYKLFPKLGTTDLEYRAKLTELCFLEKTLFEVLDFFIANADAKSEDGHKRADFYVVSALSKALFHSEFEKDLNKWKALQPDAIHKESGKLLEAHTATLKAAGKNVTSAFMASGKL